MIDFESTCWKEKNAHSQEISKSLFWITRLVSLLLSVTSIPKQFSLCAVEFPAVLLNTKTGEVESEFHTYVQPQEHPVLSDFCTELTGITQVEKWPTCTVLVSQY